MNPSGKTFTQAKEETLATKQSAGHEVAIGPKREDLAKRKREKPQIK
jgi:hypothetical protein